MQPSRRFQISVLAGAALAAGTMLAVNRVIHLGEGGGALNRPGITAGGGGTVVRDGVQPRRPASMDALVQSAMDGARRRPHDPASYTGLAVAYMRKQRESGDPGYYRRAEQAVQRSLALAPENYEAVRTLGWVRMGQHRFREARRIAERCTRLQPSDYWNYGTLGDACVELGDYPAAVRAIQRMVDLKPGLPSYSRVAYLRELHGMRGGAMRMMRMAAEAANPADAESNAWCWTQLGDLSLKGGRPEQARRQYDVALHYLPGYYAALAGEGRAAAALGRLAEAERLLSAAVAVIPRPDLLAALGDLFALEGKREQAQAQYDLVIRIEQVNRAAGAPDNRHLASFYCNHDRELPQALSLAQREYAVRDDISTCDTLAWALYKNRRFAEAWNMARRAMRLKTPEAGLLYHAGMIASRIPGRSADAHSLLRRALALNPFFDLRHAAVARKTLSQLPGPGPLGRVARRG